LAIQVVPKDRPPAAFSPQSAPPPPSAAASPLYTSPLSSASSSNPSAETSHPSRPSADAPTQTSLPLSAAPDVFLTRLPYHEDASPGWKIEGCHGGSLLLNWSTEQIAVYNPLTRALDLFDSPPDDIAYGSEGKFDYLDFFFLYSNQSPDSSRVVASCLDKSRVHAIFSSDTKEWQILSWS
jgi:hypothetical protein